MDIRTPISFRPRLGLVFLLFAAALALLLSTAPARSGHSQGRPEPTPPDPTAEAEAEAEAVDQMCRRIGAKLGSITYAECLERRFSLTGARSVRGLPILIKEFPPLPGRTPQARILLIGGIHGDEYSSVSVVFKWLQKLDQHHSGLFHWRVAPVVNPDGLLLNRPSQRMNAHGVDLNRNFPTANWLAESQDYWIRQTGRDPRRYPGPGPLSEPESHWIHDEIEQFRPDVIVSVHAPFGLLDFDGPQATPPRKLGHLYLDPMGTYPGSLGRYAGVEHGVPIVTIELSYAGIMPSWDQIRNIWVDLVRWVRANITNGQVNSALAQASIDPDEAAPEESLQEPPEASGELVLAPLPTVTPIPMPIDTRAALLRPSPPGGGGVDVAPGSESNPAPLESP